MATRGVSMTIQYVAVDTTTNMGKTGDAANHTLRWVKDGTPAAPTNAPAEVDATNCPGIYKLTLTASETNCNIGTLGGKSSTANVAIIPITIQFERLPDAAPGASGGVPVIGQAPLTNLDAAVSSRADAAYYTSARAAKLDNLDATITSRASGADYTAARAAKLDNLDATITSRATAENVWNYGSRSLTNEVLVDMHQLLPDAPASGTTGEALKFASTRLDATVSSRADSAYYTAARATKLDNLDAAVSSRATAANVWGYSTRTLTGAVDVNMAQTLPANPTSNTVGEALKFADTRLDTAVSTRADAAHYTSARAAKLDNLDAAISTRATESGVWGHSSRSLTTAVDVNMSQSLPSSPGANTVGEALKFADTRLDATVGSRATESGVWGYTTRTLTGTVDLNMNQVAPANPTADTVGDAIKSAARMRFTESDDVYAWAVNESGGGGGTVNINMDQLLPTSPTSGTVGEALKFADTRLDATVGSRATEAGVWNYTTRTLTGTVNLNMNQSVPASPTANTVGDSMKSAARIRFTDSDDVYAWAVNESGGGGGGGGNGPYAVTITVYEGQTPLEGASVRLMLGAEDYSLVTNASGRCTFYVGAGTWRWRVAKPGYMGQSATVAISEDKQLNVSLEKVIVSPSPPGQTTGYAIVYDEQGAVEPGVTVYCRLVQLNVYGVVGDTQQRSAQSNQQGVVAFPGLVKGATYAFRRSNGVERVLRVPLDAGDTIELPPLMGKE